MAVWVTVPRPQWTELIVIPALTGYLKAPMRFNRMLCVDMMLKRAMKGELDLMGPAQKVAGELMSIPDFGGSEDEGLFSKEKKYIANFKKSGIDGGGCCCAKN